MSRRRRNRSRTLFPGEILEHYRRLHGTGEPVAWPDPTSALDQAVESYTARFDLGRIVAEHTVTSTWFGTAPFSEPTSWIGRRNDIRSTLFDSATVLRLTATAAQERLLVVDGTEVSLNAWEEITVDVDDLTVDWAPWKLTMDTTTSDPTVVPAAKYVVRGHSDDDSTVEVSFGSITATVDDNFVAELIRTCRQAHP